MFSRKEFDFISRLQGPVKTLLIKAKLSFRSLFHHSL